MIEQKCWFQDHLWCVLVCFFRQQFQSIFFTKIELDFHDFSAFDTYFSYQGIRNFTNSKIHALVYMNPFVFFVFFLVVDACIL